MLRESTRVVRSRPPLVIAETRHGFVCASAGVDASNAPAADTSCCCRRIPTPRRRGSARGCEERPGRTLGVVVTDTFGRPWRLGIANVAIGAAGIEVLRDLRGVTTRPATSCMRP